jgi:hypothetical protein
MNNDAIAKIRMMKDSILCFILGLLGLLPLIGIAFGIAALSVSAVARAGERRFWNPARPYRICGVVCAAVGVIFWSFILILIIWRVLNPPPHYN